jgi:hypothetical protein
MTWALTAWGQVCAQIHARLAPEFPALTLGIGPDDWARHNAVQRLLFLGPGQTARYQTTDILVPNETLEVPTVGQRPPGKRAIRDRVCPIVVFIAAPYDGTEDAATDTSAVVVEGIYERFIAAVDYVAHGRASSIVDAQWFGGSAGRNGCAVQINMALRLVVLDNPLAKAKPTLTTVTGLSVANPTGDVVETAVPGA